MRAWLLRFPGAIRSGHPAAVTRGGENGRTIRDMTRTATLLLCLAAAAAACGKSESGKPGTPLLDAGPKCKNVHVPAFVDVPVLEGMRTPPPRTDKTTENKALACVEIKVRPFSLDGFEIAIANQREEQIALLLDESSYVNPNGMTERMVEGLSVPATQPPRPIPSGASLSVGVEGANMVDLLKIYRGTKLTYDNYLGKNPGYFASPGRLILAFKTAAGTETWEGTVQGDPAGGPEWPGGR